MKLAVFVDQKYWFDGQIYSTDESYVLFPASFVDTFDEVIFIGRLAPESGRKAYTLDRPGLRLCPLPYYESIYNVWQAGPRLYGDIRRIVRANASNWDVVWICGPNPVGNVIARQCLQLGRPVFLVVRQNLVRQMGAVNRGWKRLAAITVAVGLEGHFKQLARGRTVFTVGQEMADAYRTVTEHVHVHFPCLITTAQMNEFAQMPSAPEPNRLLCVGRLSAEKGYDYLLTALAQLRRRGVTATLDLVGSGPLAQPLQAQVAALGLADQVTCHGYVPYGPQLFDLYRRATALIVPSLSEGFPQVINEALCLGLPTIASAVGGIPALLTQAETALLTPPANSAALAEAIGQLLASPELRQRLAGNGRALMQTHTLEAQRDRMTNIIHQEVLVQPHLPYRSALVDYPGGDPSAQPTVAAVIPVYNEINYIEAVVEAMLAQDYPALTEIWLVDGLSTDGTFEALQQLQGCDPRLKVVRNPRRIQAAAINLAFSQAQTDIVIRLDGHARYTPEVIRHSVQALLSTGAGGVGAIARPLATANLLSQSIAAAHESRFGAGAARFRRESAGGWVDTVWNGCYWKYIIDKIGLLREDFWRSEDINFNARVRQAGYGLYLSPDIKTYYWPRQSLPALWHQFFINGAGVAHTLFTNRQGLGLRHLAPPAFGLSLLLPLLVATVWPAAGWISGGVLLIYLAAALLFSLSAWLQKPGRYVMLLPLVFATLHLSYGLGSLWGVGQYGYCRLIQGRRSAQPLAGHSPRLGG